MLHLADGTLRRLHDEPAAGTDAERAHLAACEGCRARLMRLGRIADDARAALVPAPETAPDVAAAHAVVVARSLASPSGSAARRSPLKGRVSAPLAGLAAALAVALLFTLTPLRSLAMSFLAIFEPKQIVAIPISRADFQQMQALPNLSSFGVMRTITRERTATVTSLTEAAALAGMPIAIPGLLPAGVTKATYFVHGRTEGTFTFSAARARASAAATGKPMPPMPPRIDGSTLIVSLGPVVVSAYGGPTRHPATPRHEPMPELFVAQAPAPRVDSTGASAREIEAYLLAQPGIPPRLAAEIAAIGDPATTLPIPIPVEKAYASPVAVQGVRGLAVGDNTGLGSGVVWERGGIIYAVGGPLTMAEAVRYANALQTSAGAAVKPMLRSMNARRLAPH